MPQESRPAKAGRLSLAQDEVLGRRLLKASVPAGTASPEYEPRVVFHPRFLQQRDELLLETPFPVMLGLSANVIDHGLPL